MARKLEFEQFEYQGRQLVSLTKACEILDLSEYRMKQLAREGLITATKFAARWWFDLEAVEQRSGAKGPANIRGL